jgi:hypothetical protein
VTTQRRVCRRCRGGSPSHQPFTFASSGGLRYASVCRNAEACGQRKARLEGRQAEQRKAGQCVTHSGEDIPTTEHGARI